MHPFRESILTALPAIDARSGGRYDPEAVYDRMRTHYLPNTAEFALLLAVDKDMLAKKKSHNTAVCGLTALFKQYDFMGAPFTFIGMGWIKPGYNGRPFVEALPHIEDWARQRGSTKLVSMTERASLSASEMRLSQEQYAARLKGLAAYCRWIGRYGFVQRESTFEKVLNAPGGFQ
jgi:hypothetical protein